MNTILVTSQIFAYGVGIVSASLNIAVFVRRRRRAVRRRLLASAVAPKRPTQRESLAVWPAMISLGPARGRCRHEEETARSAQCG